MKLNKIKYKVFIYMYLRLNLVLNISEENVFKVY